ncbi:MAG: MrtC family glutamic-type intramembrane protease [Myxococcota bacterium]
MNEGAGSAEASGEGAGVAPGGGELPEIAPGDPLREVFRNWALAALAVFVARGAGAFVPALAPYGGLLVGAVLVSLALRHAARERDGLERQGIALGGLLGTAEDDGPAGPFGVFELARTLWRGKRSALREGAVALAVTALTFPPYVLVFAAWNDVGEPYRWPAALSMASFALGQLVVIALPEEVFFRGYVQTRLGDAFAVPERGPFARLGVAPRTLGLQALLFALVHLATPAPNPARLATFVPGVAFGVLRAWRGGVGAAIAYHAACNVLAEMLFRGWLR